MSKKIVLIQGHPDPDGRHFCHALAEAYAGGATAAGHELRRIEVAQLDFPLLRSQARWLEEAPPPALQQAQAAIRWADHIVLVFPLWLGTVPVTSGLIAHIFGVKYLATLSGIAFLFHQVGSFLGVWIAGYLFDATGSYRLMWLLTIALGVLAALINLPIKDSPVVRAAPAPA